MSLARSVAVLGIGLGALAVATEGLVGAEEAVEGQDIVVGHVVPDEVASWHNASAVLQGGSPSVVAGRAVPDEVESSSTPDAVASSAVVVG